MLKEPEYITTNSLYWFGHVYRKGWRKECTQHEVVGQHEHSWPRETRQQCVNYDLKSLKSPQNTSPHTVMLGETLRMLKGSTHKECGTSAQSE